MQVLEESSTESSDNEFDLERLDSEPMDVQQSSAVALAINISKSLVGEGILSLPAGVAAGTGIIPSLVIMAAFCCLMMYSFWSIGRCCEATSARTHGEVGLVLGGRKFAAMMEVVNLLKSGLACAAYALVIGKNGSDVLYTFGVEGWIQTPQGCFLFVLVTSLLPLCFIRDLSRLAWTSLFGLLCEVAVVIFMIVRLVGGEYRVGGTFYESQLPTTEVSWGFGGPQIYTVNLSVFVLIGSMSTAFLAHYNAPKFYHQLRVRTPKTFFRATAGGYLLALLLYATGMVVGYLTFGQNCKGNILHNYSPRDLGATFCRMMIMLATSCGFPLCFTGLRSATLALFSWDSQSLTWVPVNLLLLSVIAVLGSILTDLGVVNSLGGVTLGTLIELVFPGLMIMWTYRAKLGKWRLGAFEGTMVAYTLIGLGGVLFVFGTTTVLWIKVFHFRLYHTTTVYLPGTS